VTGTVGQRVQWHGDNTSRRGTLITPALWSGTWWVHCDHPHDTDIYGCALLQWRSTGAGWWAVEEATQPMREARALVALRAAGVAP